MINRITIARTAAAMALLMSVLPCQNDGPSPELKALLREALLELRRPSDQQDLEKAVRACQQILAKDPSNAEALRLIASISSWEVEILVSSDNDSIRRAGRELMLRARSQRAERSRDTAEIQALVETATTGRSLSERGAAAQQLRVEHGEFAVPALVDLLVGEGGEAQVQAIVSLRTIGSSAVLPLMAAIESSDAAQRRSVASALANIGDARALPVFARLLETDDDAAVRMVSETGLKMLGAAADAQAIDMYVAQARSYLDGALVYGAASDVVWQWQDGRLTYTDVPNSIHALEMAKVRAHEALDLQPSNRDAAAILATAYVASAAAIEQGGDAFDDVRDLAPEFLNLAYGLGRDVLRRALTESLADGSGAQQAALVSALGELEGPNGLEDSPLLAALQSPSPGVARAAALAIAGIEGMSGAPMADRVVAILGDSVTAESLRRIKIIGVPQTATQISEASASSTRGLWVESSATAADGIGDLQVEPAFDLYIVSGDLDDRVPQTVIKSIRRRHPDAKVLVQTKAADASFDDADGIIEEDLTPDLVMAKAVELLEGFNDGGKADALARDAGLALTSLGNRGVDLGAALDSLVAQLNRDPSIAVPAAHALGAGGSLAQAGALIAVVKASDDVAIQEAAATAVGRIFARSSETIPADHFDMLIEMSKDGSLDGGVRRAISIALGSSKNPGQINRLQKSMRRFAGS